MQTSYFTVLHANVDIPVNYNLVFCWEALRRKVKISLWQFKFHLSLLAHQKRNFHPAQTSQNAQETFHIFHWPLKSQPWNLNMDMPDLTVYLLYHGEKFNSTVSSYKKVLSSTVLLLLFENKSERLVCLSPGLGCPVVIVLSSSLVFSLPASCQCTE